MHHIDKRFINALLVIVLNIFMTNIWAFELDGVTKWHQRIDLTPLSSGAVEKVAVKVGDQVRQGDLLLALEHKLETSQWKLAQQRLKQANLLYSEAQREHERIEDLYERGLISDHDRSIGEAVWVGVSADLLAAKMALVSAKRDLNQRELKAPFNAIVINREVEVGSLINHQLLQEPVLTIASSSFMRVEGVLKNNQLIQIEGKQTLKVKVTGKSMKASVESVAMEPTAGIQGQYQITLLIPYKKGLKAGMKVIISVN
ncbi:MAG: HlyD family secretion protein [Chromatiales bacterium]|nr:HlyD family secretion protein [Chromatiales bacterium]